MDLVGQGIVRAGKPGEGVNAADTQHKQPRVISLAPLPIRPSTCATHSLRDVQQEPIMAVSYKPTWIRPPRRAEPRRFMTEYYTPTGDFRNLVFLGRAVWHLWS